MTEEILRSFLRLFDFGLRRYTQAPQKREVAAIVVEQPKVLQNPHQSYEEILYVIAHPHRRRHKRPDSTSGIRTLNEWPQKSSYSSKHNLHANTQK
jgi:hypothetical protein